MARSKAKRKQNRRQSVKPPPVDPAQVNQVVKWVLAGAMPYDVVEAIKANYPGEDPSRLILEAMRHFESAGEFDPAIVAGWCFEASKDLYRRMAEIGDYPGALRAVKQIMEMAGNVQYEEETQAPKIIEVAEVKDQVEAPSLRGAQGENTCEPTGSSEGPQ